MNPELIARVAELELEVARLETLELPIATGGGNAIIKIASTTLGANSRPITFSSIPATYDHLMINGTVRSEVAGEDDFLMAHLNGAGLGDANFHSYYSFWRGSPKIVANGNLANNWTLGYMNGSTSPTKYFTAFSMFIPFYTMTDRNRTFFSHNSFGKDSSAPDIEAVDGYATGHWLNTADAINRIDFDTWAGASNFSSGTTISIWGIDNG